ncbi:Zinc transporter ZIP3 [Balamuthia mandrillaris]
MELYVWKILSILIMIVLVWFGGLLPSLLKLRRMKESHSRALLSLGNALSGGVFLCIGLAHLLPEAEEQLREARLAEGIPVSPLLAIAGFSLVLFVEKVFMGNAHSHQVLAVSTAAGERHVTADMIVVPRQLIPHYGAAGSLRERGLLGQHHHHHHGVEGGGFQTMYFGGEGTTVQEEVQNRRLSLDEYKAYLELQHEGEHQRLLQQRASEHEGHQHIEVTQRPVVPYILALVLSIHSVIEGLALGVESTVSQTTLLLIAIASHKWIEAFAFGTSFVKEGVKLKSWVGILAIYSTATPIGIGIGIGLNSALSGRSAFIAEGLLESLAAGTFLYVAIMDILSEEFEAASSKKMRYGMGLAMLLGVGLIAIVLFWPELDG